MLSNGIKVHPYAEYFPVIEGEEYEMLKEDIKKNGQLEPCVLYEGELLDGVNRMRACLDLGIEPLTEVYCGENPLDYVVSLNIRRRHLDVSQRAMLATEMLPVFEEEAKKRLRENAKQQRPEGSTTFVNLSSTEDNQNEYGKRGHTAGIDASKVFGVGRASVERAKRIKEQAPDKVQDIITGKATVSAVDNELRMERAKKISDEKNIKEIDKEVTENKRFVAEYFHMVKVFGAELEKAILGAEKGKFDYASKNFVIEKHNKLIELMKTLEGMI